MHWRRYGRIFEPAGQAPWVGTHAALPVVDRRADRDRVYFSSRDGHNRSSIGFLEGSLRRPEQGWQVSPEPVLTPGVLGTFDDAGVTSSCIVRRGDRMLLYYTGWALGVSVPFYLHVGLAISTNDGQSFSRVSTAPLLDRSEVDPYLTASPWVVERGGHWHMWYVSATHWSPAPQGPRHHYHIRYASSADGLHWHRQGRVCIDYTSPDEHAFGRPCVIYDQELFRMWYSYRGATYRLGYAESHDGIVWTRKDAEVASLDAARSDWESEMMAYPAVVKDDDGLTLLYNGNGYGRTGIGLARDR